VAPKNDRSLQLLLIPAVLLTLFFAFSFLSDRGEHLVVYCSHDSVFSEAVLRDFTAKTGITVTPRFDTEAGKSLGLTEKISLEKEQSDCDLYWSNETLSLLQLKKEGLLATYKGSGWKRIPDNFKDADGTWTGFAARLRVIIYNSDKIDAEEARKRALMQQDNLSRFTIAVPLYGTTLTHYACLMLQLGEEKLKELHNDRRQRKLLFAPGNGPVRDLVAAGKCDAGWTDTDDFFGAVDKGRPVAMLPATLPDGSTICIPNGVAILKSSRNRDAAEKLADYLLSEEVELKLAASGARQIPLGPVNSEPPADVKKLIPMAARGVSLERTLEVRRQLIDWLKQEQLR